MHYSSSVRQAYIVLGQKSYACISVLMHCPNNYALLLPAAKFSNQIQFRSRKSKTKSLHHFYMDMTGIMLIYKCP